MNARSNLSIRFVVVGCVVGTLVSAFPVIATAQVPLNIVHSFSNTTTDGGFPSASLIETADGVFFGTTTEGGPSGTGTIFKMTPAGTVTTLHTFGDVPDGEFPSGPLLHASDGNFYGTTSGGGPAFGGTVFRMTPDGHVTILKTFDLFGSGPEGHNPSGGLIEATNGYLYGTTTNGGASNRGTVFKMTLDGTVTTLHEFAITDGAIPQASMLQGADGNFYGTTMSGGGGLGCGGIGCGTVFRMTPDGVVTVIHAFQGAGTDGDSPQTHLIQARDGNFYGTTYLGGGDNAGIVFRVTPLGALTVVHEFQSLTEGFNPRDLIQAIDGYFYGTTKYGPGRGCGGFGCGSVFRMAPGGAITTIHTFTGTPDGANPYAGLVEASDTTLYGTTSSGGDVFEGTVFRLDPVLCRDTLTLGYSAGTLSLGFTLESAVPTTWSTWAIFSGGVANLWSAPIPAVHPRVSFTVPISGVPPIGGIGLLTVMSTPSQGVVCFDWQVTDTAAPMSAVPRLHDHR
jgi:uncharacterized repeat protein (TIGR03803 family)